MKKTFILCLFAGVFFIAKSQVMTIIDKETNEVLQAVVLISENPRVTAVTNTKGQAEIMAFKDAEKIQIRSLGYKTQFLSYGQIQHTNFKIELEPSSLNLDQVVVSATRWQQASGNVPSKIVSINFQEVALHNPQTAADLLSVSGKVFVQKSQQGGGSPMIRGFATNRLVYSVDGVRMNTAIFRGGNLQNVINLDPFAIENTEVLFGPGSVIYGSDAIGGVMSFQTLAPEFSLDGKPFITGKAVNRYSSANNEKTFHFDVNIGWKKWALVTSFSSWDFGHLRQGANGPNDYIKNTYPQRQDSTDVVITQDDPLLQIPSAYSQVNLMQKIRYRPNENLNFQYGFHYSTTSSYGRYDRHCRIRNGNLRYSEWQYGPQMWMMNILSINHEGNNFIYDQLNIRIALQFFEESRIDRPMNGDERNTQTENVDAFSVNFDFKKCPGPKNTLYYGGEFVLNHVASKGVLTNINTGIDQNGPSRYPQAKWSSIAAYLNDELRVSDKLTLQAGLRYNCFMLYGDFSNNLDFYPFPFTTVNVNNRAITGNVGGVYRPAESWVLRSSLGTAFRSPNVDDIGKIFDSEPGTVTVPNPFLEAEYAISFDLGIAKVLRDMVRVDLTGYYTLLLNAIVRRAFQLNGQDSIIYNGALSQVQALQNAAMANVYGVQAGLEIKLPEGFTILTDLNFQAGEEELDDGTVSPTRHAAPWFGVSRLRYHHKLLTLEFYTMYQGERNFNGLPQEEKAKDEIYAKDSNGNNYSPAWYTLNFKTLYRLTETFLLSCGIENLTDQRYRPYSSGISGAGRNLVFSLKAGF